MSSQPNGSVSPHSTNEWHIFDYEVEMYFGTRKILMDFGRDAENIIMGNALTESTLLHTRILIDILLCKEKDDDISLKTLLPNWQESGKLKTLHQKLDEVYSDRKTPNSPCWTLNKMLAHPSSLRQDRHNYTEILQIIDPIIVGIINEIGILSKRSYPESLLLPFLDNSLGTESPTTYTHTPVITTYRHDG